MKKKNVNVQFNVDELNHLMAVKRILSSMKGRNVSIAELIRSACRSVYKFEEINLHCTMHPDLVKTCLKEQNGKRKRPEYKKVEA